MWAVPRERVAASQGLACSVVRALLRPSSVTMHHKKQHDNTPLLPPSPSTMPPRLRRSQAPSTSLPTHLDALQRPALAKDAADGTADGLLRGEADLHHLEVPQLLVAKVKRELVGLQ